MMFRDTIFRNTTILLLSILFLFDGLTLAEDTPWRQLPGKEQALLLEKLVELQKSIETFQSAFSEQRSTKVLKSPLHFEGRIYYDAKGLFFMQYFKPVKYILRVRGGEVLFYVEGSTTADMADLSNVEGMAKHSSLFVWDPGDFKGSIWESDDEYRLEDASGEVGERKGEKKVLIFLDRKNLHMKRIRIDDEFGDVTEISLSEQRINEELPPSVLHFSLPAGTKINRMDTLQ
jgi:outer membrane lipoprotein-sorting protein